ncbi:MAG: 3-deoxy-manno-octulosonate cytidylyltransferase [Parachlamydiales bacterium]
MNKPISESVLGIIPARFASQRFPGKPLAFLAGKSLLQRTYENAQNSKCFDHIVIATDDERIYEHAVGFGAEVFMTPVDCPTGTDRISTLLKNTPKLKDYSLIVNIQGDEPCVSAESFRAVISALTNNPDAVVGTLVTPLTCLEQAKSRSIVKCVRALNGKALYFTRSLIPGGKTDDHQGRNYYRHIGVYAFRNDFLIKYDLLEPTPLQSAEDLEQLKILEHGYTIATACVEEEAIGVDTPEDLHNLELKLCTVNISLSPAASVHP